MELRSTAGTVSDIDGFLFDLDGVLADSHASINTWLTEWAEQHGLDPAIMIGYDPAPASSSGTHPPASKPPTRAGRRPGRPGTPPAVPHPPNHFHLHSHFAHHHLTSLRRDFRSAVY